MMISTTELLLAVASLTQDIDPERAAECRIRARQWIAAMHDPHMPPACRAVLQVIDGPPINTETGEPL